MYFATMAPDTGTLQRLIMIPMQRRRLRLQCAPTAEAHWLLAMLNREGYRLGTGAVWHEDHTVTLHWSADHNNRSHAAQGDAT